MTTREWVAGWTVPSHEPVCVCDYTAGVFSVEEGAGNEEFFYRKTAAVELLPGFGRQ